MEGEFGALVDLLEGLDRLAARVLGLGRAERSLVHHSVQQADAVVHEKLQDWPVHVGEHNSVDKHADVVEPERIVVGVESVEDVVDQWDSRVAEIQASEELNQAVIDVGDVKDGKHDERGLS